MEIVLWVMFILFLVLSNIASYKLGYTRGLLKGIVTFELLKLREATKLAVSRMMWHGDPDVQDHIFTGLQEEKP